MKLNERRLTEKAAAQVIDSWQAVDGPKLTFASRTVRNDQKEDCQEIEEQKES